MKFKITFFYYLMTLTFLIACNYDFNEEQVDLRVKENTNELGESVRISWRGKKVIANKIDSDYLIGDIAILPDNLIQKGVGINPNIRSDHKWPNGVIIYIIDQELIDSDNFTGDDRIGRIEEAMRIIESKTSIKFKVRTDEEYFVKFVPGAIPHSMIGMKITPSFLFKNIGQKLQLSVGVPTYTIIHEMMHCLGFYHEQSRLDRDDYIIVNENNIKENAISQFEIAPPGFNRNYGEFNWNSIMLYDSFTAAKDRSIPSMTRLDGTTWNKNTIFSQSDIDAINDLYSGDGSNNNTPADVSENFWAFNEVVFMWQNGYIRGDDGFNYKPNDQLTRAQLASLISNVIDPAPIRSDISFIDVSTTFWARNAISKAVKGGYLSGFNDQTFRPNDIVTKLEMTVALSNGLQLRGGSSAHLELFADSYKIPSWAKTAVQNATAGNLVFNYPDNRFFKPYSKATRAEAAAFFHRTLVHLGKAESLRNPFLISF